MLTPDDLRKMTPEQRTELFDKLCRAYYGDRLTQPTVAADFDVTRETVFRWGKNHNVPWAVLFTLDRWLNSDVRAAKIIADWGTIPQDLATVAAQMSRVAGTMARIARLSEPVSLDTGSASLPPEPASEQ